MAQEVFISYATLDKRVADAVCATLESNNIKCWMAPRDILPGVDFAESIINAIEKSRVFVLILSNNSSISPHVLREINKAASSSIAILSFIIEEVTLSKSMEYYLSTDHWLNAISPPLSKHIQVLAITVEKLLKQLAQKEQNDQPETKLSFKEIEDFSNKVRRESSEDITPITKMTSKDLAPAKKTRADISLNLKKDTADKTQLTVDSSGRGDYPSIMTAVAAASPGQTIVIKAGTYREKIFLNKAVKLCGEGKDKVKISFDTDSVLEVAGQNGIEIKGLSFSPGGGRNNKPVCLLNGSLLFMDCRVAGGEKGIHIHSGTPVLRDNLIERNHHSGIYIDNNASPILESNYLSNNECAIFFADEAKGRALANRCTKNTVGITVSDNAAPELEANICNDNRETGITYINNAGGKAISNECKKNINGIAVIDNSKPILEKNLCSQNREAGLFYNGRGAGTARANDCNRNNTHGIHVSQKCQPFLEGNQSTRNKLMGIAYFDSSAGTASYNHCVRNDLHGILVRAQAQPNLEGNQCNDNKEAGIAYFDNARGLARGNVCRGNRVTDITVNGQATPIIG
ncbi:MAG: right-handed parallel beta-helix repeat-containing protein [Syntrophomonadaceae bacterium]|nr:right-handed parallel beta-helix repeat-containing protein [Syntrophomonadaceae bacterium]